MFARLRCAVPRYLREIGIWNVLMGAYAANGAVSEAVALFAEMQRSEGIAPDAKAFVTLLSACSHGGDVRRAQWLWRHEMDQTQKRNARVVSAFVDCLARNGALFAAFDAISDFEASTTNEGGQRCEEMWLALHNGCQIHSDSLLNCVAWTDTEQNEH